MEQKQINNLNKVTRWVMRVLAIALAIGALKHNPAHLFTAGLIWALGDCLEWEKKEVRR